MSAWQELKPPVYPEGDYVGVFCNKCGGKNRQDKGWRYCDNPNQSALMASMPPHLMMMMASLGRRPAQLTYECAYCRDDDKRRSPDDEQSESDEEDEDEIDEEIAEVVPEQDADGHADKGGVDAVKKEAVEVDQEAIVAVPAAHADIKAEPSTDEKAISISDVVSDSDKKRKVDVDVEQPAPKGQKCAKNDSA